MINHNTELGKYVPTFGKFAGRCLDQIPLKELDSYVAWVESLDHASQKVFSLKEILKQYLAQPNIAAELERELEER